MTGASDGGEAERARAILREIGGDDGNWVGPSPDPDAVARAAAEAIRSLESPVAEPGPGQHIVEDYEAIHIRADDTLLTFLDAIGHPKVADAYRRLRARIKFHYA